MPKPNIDYDKLAQEAGATGGVDYDALAREAGGQEAVATVAQPTAESKPDSLIGGLYRRGVDTLRGLGNLAAPPQSGSEWGEAAVSPLLVPLVRMARGYVQSVPAGLKQARQYASEAHRLPSGNTEMKALDYARSGLTALGALNPLTSGTVEDVNRLSDEGRMGEAAGQGFFDAAMLATPFAGKGVVKIAETIPDVNPDVAALKALRVSPASNRALKTIESVKGARPFLKGVQSLEDLQAKIKPAKEEVWRPYQQAIDAIGDRPVKGPDGITTIRSLEKERLKISALLRDLKNQNPEAIQLAQQKGLTQADLLNQERAIKDALDPELESVGIKPQLIRRIHGNISQVGQRVSGKSTLAEPSKPFGFGRIRNIKFGQPRSWLGEPLQGLRDLASGRPWWSGKPTDVFIREAFGTGGEKPDFGMVSLPQIKGLLQAPMQEIPLGEAPGPGEMPGGLFSAQPFPAQNVGEARIIRNAKGQILPKSARKVEFPDESGRLPVARDYKGRLISRKPTRRAYMTSGNEELQETPPISGPGVLLRRPTK